MKISFSYLFVLAVLVLSISSAQEASAQGARYKFPIHYWKQEQSKMPVETATIKAGDMPQSADFLGLPPISPDPQPSPPMTASVPLSARTVIPSESFKSEFGSPADLPESAPSAKALPVKVASLTESAKSMRRPSPRKPIRIAPANSNPRTRHFEQSKSVHAKLRNSSQPQCEPVSSEISSYPGGYIPGDVTYAKAISAKRDVHGIIIH